MVKGQGNVVYIENHAMNGWLDVKLYWFLTTADESERLTTRFVRFIFGKRVRGTVWIRRRLGPTDGLNAEAKKARTLETHKRTKNNKYS